MSPQSPTAPTQLPPPAPVRSRDLLHGCCPSLQLPNIHLSYSPSHCHCQRLIRTPPLRHSQAPRKQQSASGLPIPPFRCPENPSYLVPAAPSIASGNNRPPPLLCPKPQHHHPSLPPSNRAPLRSILHRRVRPHLDSNARSLIPRTFRRALQLYQRSR